MSVLAKAIGRLVNLQRHDSQQSPSTQSFIEHNRGMWRDFADARSRHVVLADFHQFSGTQILWSYWLNILAEKHGARIAAYTFDPPPSWRQALNFRCSPEWKVWKSFNTTELVYCRPESKKISRHQLEGIATTLLKEIRTKEDIFNIKIFGYPLGLDLYESYLRARRWPADPVEDPVFAKWLVNYCGWTAYWMDYFESVSVKALVVSHDCFHHNILCRIANAAGIPVYTSNLAMAYAVPRPFMFAERCRDLRRWFDELPEPQQSSGKAWAKRKLDERLAGARSIETAYITQSPFHARKQEDRVIGKSDNLKVLIATHCFFDNPHSYSGMLFPDFYDWLVFLNSIARETTYDWYLKVHRDPLPGTMEIVEHLLGHNAPIKLVPSEASHQQLIDEDIDVALTCYGTIGIEYAALGLPVVNACRDNPHSAYNFNIHPKNRDDYRRILLDLENHAKKLKIDMQEVYECYFMKYNFLNTEWPGALAYPKIIESVGPEESATPKIFEYFLQHWNPEIHARIMEQEAQFLLGDAPFNTKLGPRKACHSLPEQTNVQPLALA